MKCRIDLCHGTDRVVLQVSRRHWPQLQPEVDAILNQMSRRLRPQTPIATLPMGPGLAIAEGTGDLSSFGRGISRRMAEILLQTRQASSLAEKVQRAQSLAPELNPDSQSFSLASANNDRPAMIEPRAQQSSMEDLDQGSMDEAPIPELQKARQELVRDGIVPSDVLDFGLEVTLLYRRHQNVRARLVHPAPRGVWTDLFIKRADPLVEGSRESLFREQALFQQAREEPLVDLLAPWLIPPLLFPTPTPDPGPGRRSWLVFPWRSGTGPLFQAGTDERCGIDLGQALATVHLGFRLPSVDPRCRTTLGIEPPSTLFLNIPSTSVLRRASGAHLELLRLFQREETLSAVLDRRRSDWNDRVELQGTVIHGDLCAGNMLRQGHRALLVDWEHARWGDPAFDVGSVLATVAVSLIAGSESLERGQAQSSLRSAARGFWRQYQQLHRQCGAPIDSGFLSRVTDFWALRLLQAAWDRCSGKNWPTSRMLSLIQLAAVLLADPKKTSRALFGFPLETDS